MCAEVIGDIDEENKEFTSSLFRRIATNPCLYLLENSGQVVVTTSGRYCFRMDAPSSIRLQLFKDCVEFMHKQVVKVVLNADRSEAYIKTTLTYDDVRIEQEISELLSECPKCDTFYGEYFDCDVCGPSAYPGSIIIHADQSTKSLT